MRTRYVHRNGKIVEKHQATPTGPLVLSDIQEFVTQDGVAITSRSQLRDYERKNGVRQVGNDWTGPSRPPFWDAFEQKRKNV
jgi:hypothetical protein